MNKTIIEELEKKFEIEKMEKNKAYLFILQKGLLGKYIEFCYNYYGNPFEDILKILIEEVEKTDKNKK